MLTTTIRSQARKFSRFALGDARLKALHDSLKAEWEGFTVKKVKLPGDFVYIFSIKTDQGTLYIG